MGQVASCLSSAPTQQDPLFKLVDGKPYEDIATAVAKAESRASWTVQADERSKKLPVKAKLWGNARKGKDHETSSTWSVTNQSTTTTAIPAQLGSQLVSGHGNLDVEVSQSEHVSQRTEVTIFQPRPSETQPKPETTPHKTSRMVVIARAEQTKAPKPAFLRPIQLKPSEEPIPYHELAPPSQDVAPTAKSVKATVLSFLVDLNKQNVAPKQKNVAFATPASPLDDQLVQVARGSQSRVSINVKPAEPCSPPGVRSLNKSVVVAKAVSVVDLEVIPRDEHQFTASELKRRRSQKEVSPARVASLRLHDVEEQNAIVIADLSSPEPLVQRVGPFMYQLMRSNNASEEAICAWANQLLVSAPPGGHALKHMAELVKSVNSSCTIGLEKIETLPPYDITIAHQRGMPTL